VDLRFTFSFVRREIICDTAVGRHGTGMNPNIVDEGKKTQFKPGQSGNPAGPPHRRRIRDLLVAVIEVPLSPKALKLVRPALRAHLGEGVTYGELLAESIILRGIDKADCATWREGLACEASAAESMDSD
jgi:hypothetical protein